MREVPVEDFFEPGLKGLKSLIHLLDLARRGKIRKTPRGKVVVKIED